MLNRCGNYLIALAVAAAAMVGATATEAQKEDPAGPPKPVTVINTTSNPVPVAFGPKETVEVYYSGSIQISSGQFTTFGPFDVSKFSQVRVTVFNDVNSSSTVQVGAINVMSNGDGIPLDSYTPPDPSYAPTDGPMILARGRTLSRVYDVPGRYIKISLFSGPGDQTVRVAVFGR